MSTLVQRVVNVAKLDVPTFEEVEHNESLNQEAGIVVAVASAIGALGQFLTGGGFLGFILAIVMGIVGWLLWSLIVSLIASKVFGGTTDFGEMLRATGYAWAPMAIPFIGWIWAIVAIVVGIRQAGDFSTGKAVITAIAGFIPWALGLGIITSVVGG